MSILLKRLKITNKSNLSETTNILDDENINVKISLDNKGSSMQISLKNAYKEHIVDGDLKYGVGDTIQLYCKYTVDASYSLDTTDDLIMTAEITETGYTLANNKSMITLNCTDKTYLLLNKLWAFNYKDSLNLSAPELIRDIIRINTPTGTSIRGYVGAELVSKGGYIQDTRPQAGSEFSTAFPSPITAVKVYKPVYEWIADLSQIDKTNSSSELDPDTGTMGCLRPMVFYLDENNNAHWEYPGTTSSTYTLTTGVDNDYKVISFSLKKATFDVVNMVIFNSGDDFNGSGILNYFFDPNADPNQLKPTYRPWTNITKDVMANELGTNSAKYSAASYGTLTFHNGQKYTADYGTPWYPTWNTSGSTVSDDSELNASLRTYAIDEGKNKARNITSTVANPRYKGTITVKFFKYNVGSLIDFSSPLHGISNILVRITTIQHTITKNGAFTILSVEEDANEYNS